MAANTAAFIKASGLTQVDVLGFSLGGPSRAGTRVPPDATGHGPRGGEGMASLTPDQQHYQ